VAFVVLLLTACVRYSCTGEGIHTAMVAGKIAAHSVSDMFERCNFTLEACRAYGESPAVS
jgi:flavin-dependent dehydrogenase